MLISEIERADKLTVQYEARYEDLLCEGELSDEATENINRRLNNVLDTVPCLIDKQCRLEGLEITNCGGASRRKRGTETAGFTITVTTNPNEGIK